MRRKKHPHIVMHDEKIVCLHCGQSLTIPVPIGINVFLAMSKAFGKDHKNCEKK